MRRGGQGWKRTLAVMAVIAAGSGARGDWFVRGDAGGRPGLSLVDAVALLRHLYLGEPAARDCQDALDVNDDGSLDVADAIHLLQHLFQRGPAPPARIPDCWYDTGEDGLGCTTFEECSPQAVVFCVDRSGGFFMGLPRSKVEILAGLAGLGEDDELALTFFDSNLIRFPVSEEPLQATAENKQAAMEFTRNVAGGGGTCPLPALLRALAYLNAARAERKVILYFSDGFATCPGQDLTEYSQRILDEVRSRNAGVTIHTIAVAPPGGMDEDWMGTLADQNGGSFIWIDPSQE